MGGAAAEAADEAAPQRVSSSQHAVAGSVAGVTARFFIAPLDVVKIRLQSQPEPIGRKLGGAGTGVSQPKYRGMLASARTIVAEEGVRALWKGNWSAELLYLGYGGVQFFFYDAVHELIAGQVRTRRDAPDLA